MTESQRSSRIVYTPLNQGFHTGRTTSIYCTCREITRTYEEKLDTLYQINP